MKSAIALPSLFCLALALNACAGADLQGISKKSGEADKKQDPTIDTEDQTAVPPEVLAGAYLSCSSMEPTSEEIADGGTAAEGDVVGCMVFSTATDKPVVVQSYKTNWTVLNGSDSPVAYKQISLKPASLLSFAARLEKGVSANDLKVILRFPGSKIEIREGNKAVEIEKDSGVAVVVSAELSKVTPCTAETDALKTQNGGCHHLASGLVIGGLNLDPSTYGKKLSESQMKSVWHSEATNMCKKSRAGGFLDWRLPSKEEMIKLQGAKLGGKLSFLPAADAGKTSGLRLYNESPDTLELRSDIKYGYWTSSKTGMGKYYSCEILDDKCFEVSVVTSQQFSFCVRSAPTTLTK